MSDSDSPRYWREKLEGFTRIGNHPRADQTSRLAVLVIGTVFNSAIFWLLYKFGRIPPDNVPERTVLVILVAFLTFFASQWIWLVVILCHVPGEICEENRQQRQEEEEYRRARLNAARRQAKWEAGRQAERRALAEQQ